jgi:hypothetical protein
LFSRLIRSNTLVLQGTPSMPADSLPKADGTHETTMKTPTTTAAATTTTMAATTKTTTTKPAEKPQETTPERPSALVRSPTTVDIDSDVADIFSQLPAVPNPLPTPHAQFVHCMPPEAPTYRDFSVFLAGSIEMGAAVQWQKQLALLLSPLPITVNNPRRGEWDPTATQEAKNVAFRAQVEWELSALEKADVICFFFDVNTKSPVTLLELGLWAHSGKVVVCCDRRYWRAGNVHIVCERYNIPYVESFGELVPEVTKMLGEKGMQLDERGDLVRSG